MDQTRRPRILLADDDPDSRLLVAEILSAQGAEMVAVSDGQEAVQQAAQAPFDLCILDIEMPKLNGLEACPRLRATAFTRDLPVLFLTAQTDEEIVERALAAGAMDYLNKPITPGLLWRRVSNAMLLARLMREKEGEASARKASSAQAAAGSA
jgi:putative two-component system response regulator